MSEHVVQRFGPEYYCNEPGAFEQLPEILNDRRWHNVLLVHGHRSWEAAKPYLPLDQLTNVAEAVHQGECSESEMERIKQLSIQHSSDVIIGVGGGKILDTVKAVSARQSIPCVLLPTLASNCASFTPISIVYKEDGSRLGTLRHRKSNNVVLVEPRIIAEAPIEAFRSGLGDTLAKWYEARVRLSKIPQEERSLPLQLSFNYAKTCRDTVFENGRQALDAVKEKTASLALQRVIDTIFIAAGLVGGLAEAHGRSVGAHAFFNASTFLGLEAVAPHGTLVAYGILLQLELESKLAEQKQVLDLYQDLGLPTKLAQVGLSLGNEQQLSILARHMTDSDSRIHELPFDVTAERVRTAIEKLEARAQQHAEKVETTHD